MNKVTAAVLGALILSLAPFSVRAEVRIGFMDMAKVFLSFQETIEAEEIYKKEVEVWKRRAEEMEAEIGRLREEIQGQSLMLSETALAEKRNVYNQKLSEYQTFMQEVFGEEGLAARKNRELTQPILEKINGVVGQIAQEEGLTIVFDSSQNTIVYALPEIDLTDKVIERLGTQMETAR